MNSETEKRKRRYSDSFVQSQASLDTSDDGDQEESGQEREPPRRSTRIRTRSCPIEEPQVVNRCVKLTPKSSESQIKKYYLNKTVKLTNLSLETIFEQPQQTNSGEVLMSTRKYRRCLNFEGVASKNNAKMKRRKAKAKAVLGSKKLKKLSKAYVLKKLNELDED